MHKTNHAVLTEGKQISLARSATAATGGIAAHRRQSNSVRRRGSSWL